MDRIFTLSENVRRRIRIPSYLFASLAVLLGTILRGLLTPVLGNAAPLSVFFLSVVISGWYGGLTPVLLSTALSIIISYIFFTEPYMQLTHKGLDDIVRIIVFAVGGLIVGFISESRLRREKKIEMLLKEAVFAKKRVEKTLSFRDQFISIASHELKTPLTTASLILQVLYAKNRNKKNVAHIINLKSQMDKLTKLINDFLDISKIQNGKLQIQRTATDLNLLVKEVVRLERLTVIGHKIHMRGRVRGLVLCDKERINQVVVNLISNASKYSPAHTDIIVSLNDKGKEAVVGVRDYGIGIDPAHQQKIFRRFFRVEGKNEKVFKGFGIGLYICAEIIKKHKGKIWVESKVKRGSLFCFSLPKYSPLK